MSRERTNSITHLVRIVAEEVFNENYGKSKDFDEEVERRLTAIENELEEKDIINNDVEKRLSDLEGNVKIFRLKKGEEKIVTILDVPRINKKY